jgi:hypothetical protein
MNAENIETLLRLTHLLSEKVYLVIKRFVLASNPFELP